MAVWYVRPDASHGGTNDGTSFENAWQGLASVTWGASGANGANNDTLYICGAHSFGAVTALGAHGGTDATHRLIVRGDYDRMNGSITLTAGVFYFNVNRSHTTFANITFNSGDNRCVGVLGVVAGVTFQNVTFNGTGLPCIEFMQTNAYNFTNIVIDSCIFNGGGGGGGSAIHWSPGTSAANFIAGLTVSNCTFNGGTATRGVIVLKPIGVFGGTAPQATTKMGDIDIHGNTFLNCAGVIVEAYGPEIYGRNTGLKIYGNTIRSQTIGSTGLGGGFALGGFVSSSTTTFGPNVVYENSAYGLIGPTGFCNPMYGSYQIYNNYAENISTGTIDGCGILFDHGADGCVAFGNEFRRITTSASVVDYTGGAGIGIIYDATNITVYGNIVDGCVMGLWMANQTSGRSTNIFNNHFLNCSLTGVQGNNTTFGADPNYCRNNIFTASSSTATAINYTSGAWSGESYNNCYGFAVGTQALHVTSVTVNPGLNARNRPTSATVVNSGTYLGGRDFRGKEFAPSPNMGAVGAAATARLAVVRTARSGVTAASRVAVSTSVRGGVAVAG